MSYIYSVQNDFSNHVVSSDRLQQEIQASSITIALDRIDVNGDVCEVFFKAALSGGEETTLAGIISAHSGSAVAYFSKVELVTPAGSAISVDPSGRIRTSAEKSSISKTTIFSHNWCDKTTWYCTSSYVSDETATDSGNHISYSLAHTYIIDTYHGKLSGERYLKNSNNISYRVSVRKNGVAKTEQDPHYGSGGDYTVNYITGVITFLSANIDTDVITCDYHYAVDSTFILKPVTGSFLVASVEVQFTDDIVLTDSVVFQPYGFVDVFAPQLVGNGEGQIPSGTKIPLGNPLVYQTMTDFYNDCSRSYVAYPPMGGSGWRGCQQSVLVLDWDYTATTDIFSEYGMEIRISLEHHTALTGGFVLATFYCQLG